MWGVAHPRFGSSCTGHRVEDTVVKLLPVNEAQAVREVRRGGARIPLPRSGVVIAQGGHKAPAGWLVRSQ